MRIACCMLLGSLAVLLPITVGCSGGDQPAKPSAKAKSDSSPNASDADSAPKQEPAKPSITKIDLKTLDPNKGFSPPLDEGRIQVPVLADWIVPPRSSQWLFRFQRDKKTAYPQIFITVDANAPAEVEPLTKKNVIDFTAQWQQELDKSHDAGSFGQQATPIQLGDRYAAECLIYVASSESKQEQMLLKLIENNRIYTLELRALRGTLEGYRSSLYAVAAGLKPMPAANEAGEQGFGGFGEGDSASPADKSSE